jgi:hypothetical protein
MAVPRIARKRLTKETDMLRPDKQDKRRKEALERNEKYQALSLARKLEIQVRGGHNGKQRRKLEAVLHANVKAARQ